MCKICLKWWCIVGYTYNALCDVWDWSSLVLISSFVASLRGSTGCCRPVHYIDVIMTTMASQITSLAVVYSTVYSDADQRKCQSSASLAFVWGIHRDRWIPAQRASHAENVSIWWRHHDVPTSDTLFLTTVASRNNAVQYSTMFHKTRQKESWNRYQILKSSQTKENEHPCSWH